MEVYKQLINYIENINLPPNPAVIFDIDGTLINFDRNPIYPIISFYHYCLYRKFTIFIVTARLGYHDNIIYTQNELKRNNITNYSGLYLLKHQDPVRFKYMSRKHIAEKGYNTILSIGDNDFDSGDYGGQGVLYNPHQNTIIWK